MTTLPDPDTTSRARTIGMVSMIAGLLFFSVNDTAIKFLSGDYALHQIVLIRSAVAMAVLLTLVVPFQGGVARLRTRHIGTHLMRGALVVVANMSFFAALAAMPLADAVAVFFIAPMLITAMSVLLLGETVGPRRWAAVAVGMIGVIVILRPGTEAYQAVALLPLIGATAYALVNILTRRIGGTESAVSLAFYIQVTFLAVSSLMGLAVGDGRLSGTGDASLDFLLRAWVWPEAGDWPILILLGVCAGMGSLLVGQGYRLCEAGLAAPFEYIAMPLAVFWGAAVFGEWPDAVSWTGILLIVVGGLYMIWCETGAGAPVAPPRPRR